MESRTALSSVRSVGAREEVAHIREARDQLIFRLAPDPASLPKVSAESRLRLDSHRRSYLRLAPPLRSMARRFLCLSLLCDRLGVPGGK
ncbi:hypothetical protein HPP92_010423 [Vanilla planifolia]|uniref:Uncharacterized protein n=1 Tax=Vanilla planifolia TaxID=51239 RepID=A0A835R542_VANPL|nr:hypothetical protein HPP92_010423 [Vanilla planifolia]